MKGFRIGRLLGISIELHYTFILLIAFIALFLLIFEPANLVSYLTLLFFLFLSVFVHEFFHSMVAIAQGTKVRKIMLLPIGGIAFTDKIPEKPMEELKMALAGPLFNLLIAAVILLTINLVPGLPWPGQNYFASAGGLSTAILQFPLFALFWVNLILGGFNLFVPALPLDGGRVLRALLALRLGQAKATVLASQVSTFFAFLLFLLGFFSLNLLILIIAVFVFLGARAETQTVLLREYLKGIDLGKFIQKKPFVLEQKLSLQQALQKMTKTNKTSALVKNKGKFYYFDLDLMHKIPKSQWLKTSLAKVARPLPKISPKAKAEKAMALMMEKGLSLLPVEEKGKFKGVVEEQSLANLYQLSKIKRE